MIPPALEIFIDESGDLGFSEQSTRYFVVAYLVTSNAHSIRTKISRLKKNMNNKRKGSVSEFKFGRDGDLTRTRVLTEICKCDFELGLVVIDKAYVKPSLRSDPPLLYRYLVANYVVTNLVNAYDLTAVRFIVDKSLMSKGMQAFNSYLTNKLSWRQEMEKGDQMPTVEIVHEHSEAEPCLQVADYCAGATFSRFERMDSTYYDLIRSRIGYRTPWGNIDW
jgi:Protein of unknown function (DUF3800)